MGLIEGIRKYLNYHVMTHMIIDKLVYLIQQYNLIYNEVNEYLRKVTTTEEQDDIIREIKSILCIHGIRTSEMNNIFLLDKKTIDRYCLSFSDGLSISLQKIGNLKRR